MPRDGLTTLPDHSYTHKNLHFTYFPLLPHLFRFEFVMNKPYHAMMNTVIVRLCPAGLVRPKLRE